MHSLHRNLQNDFGSSNRILVYKILLFVRLWGNVGLGGGGILFRSASLVVFFLSNSSFRLISPFSIAQRWLNENIGLSKNESFLSNGFSASSFQSNVTLQSSPSCSNIQTPLPRKSPNALMVKPCGFLFSATIKFQRNVYGNRPLVYNSTFLPTLFASPGAVTFVSI